REYTNPNIALYRRPFQEGIFYHIVPVSDSPEDISWDLVVQDPVTAVQCCRHEWGPSRSHVAQHLLEMGIAFSTRLRTLRQPRFQHPGPHPYVGLGWRSKGYKPDWSDYTGYLAHQAIFLRKPHARAALLKGGILWRLSCEDLDPFAV